MSRNRDEPSKGNKTSVFTEDNSKLEWMYKSGTDLLNREEYLMGKTIDKQFEKLDDEEKRQKALHGVTVPKNHVEHECIPFSIRAYRHVQNDEQVDIQRKIIEDPLMQIRQREMESRRRILENPVKLKELHRLLKEEQSSKKSKPSSKKNKSKKKKDKKSHKKKKKHRNSSESSSSSDEDLDKLLARKYRQMRDEFGPNDGTFDLKKLLGKDSAKILKDEPKPKKTRKGSVSERDSDSDASDGRNRQSRKPQKDDVKRSRYQEDRRKPEGKRDARHSRSRSPSKKRRSRSRDKTTKYRKESASDKHGDNKREKKIYTVTEKGQSSRDSGAVSRNNPFRKDPYNSKDNSSKPQRKDSSSDDSSTSSSEDNREDDHAPKKNYGLVSADGKRIELKRSNHKTESTTPPRDGESSSKSKSLQQQPAKTQHRERLTEEEKEKRYREMMENAEWRDKERKEQVKKYREESERDRTEHKDFDRNFINKAMHKAMQAHTSVESRLKSNINNIQRSGRAMDSNFARR